MEDATEDAAKAEENACEEEEKPSSPTENEQQLNKITILLHAVPNAPILKNRRWLVARDRSIGSLVLSVRKLLNVSADESVFLYVNQAFAPSPDHTIGNLANCFSVDNVLNIHYCKSQAWG